LREVFSSLLFFATLRLCGRIFFSSVFSVFSVTLWLVSFRVVEMMNSLRTNGLPLLGVLLLLSTGTPSATGQTPGKVADQAKAPSPTKADAPAPTKKAPETLLELIVAGGPLNIAFLSVLGFFSLVALSVILERAVNLRAGKLVPAGFVRELQELVRRKEDDPQPFRVLADRYPSAIASVLKAGLLRAGRPVSEVEKAMEDAAARELGILRSRVRPLTVLSSVGPLVGLLGTAVGMILVFRTASEVGPGKAELLAEGIYLKLETTVAGLIVAIPSVLFAAVFYSRSETLLRRIDEHLMEAMPCFARMETNQLVSTDERR
jgi:biopolymer transport protein ExbB